MKYQILYSRLLVSILCLSLFFTDSTAQEMPEEDKETFNQGVFHFEKKDFQNGLSYFRALINKYPRDPVFNYFSGVSMTELKIDLETAIRQLQLASVGKVPNNVYFYLAKAHHLRSEYDNALLNYQQFKKLGERIEIKELEVDKMMGLCRSELIPADWNIQRKDVAQRTQGSQTDAGNRKNLNNVKSTGSTEYDRLLEEALELQSKADSVRKLADQKRIALRIISDDDEKSSIEKEILALEKNSYDFQNQADTRFEEIRNIESRIAQRSMNTDPNVSTSGLQPGYQFKDEMELNPGMMLGRQLDDEHYFEDLVRDLFPEQKESALESLIRTNSNAVQFMKNAGKIEKDINQEELKASGAKSKRENSRILNKIKMMEEEAMQHKYNAIMQYQKVNDDLYQIFDQEIAELKSHSVGKPQMDYSGMYQKQASQAYNNALEIREEAGTLLNIEKKFDKIAEANAYELIALENQKRAYATLTGALPIPETVTSRVQDQQAENIVKAKLTGNNQLKEVAAQTGDKLNAGENAVEQVVEPAIKATVTESNIVVKSRYESIEEKYGFEVTSSSPYSDKNPIPMDRILPGGVIYRIQVGVFSRMVRPDYYRTLSPVTAETDLDKRFIRYYTGFFKEYSEAEKALPLIHQEGFKDAFIIAHFQDRKITLNRAKELEVLEKNQQQTDQEGRVFSAIQKPLYRIQFGIFPTQLTEMSLGFYKAKAGKNRIQALHNINGEYVYTIGIFLTFEEAEATRKMLLSKGLDKLEIIRFIGNRRIDSE